MQGMKHLAGTTTDAVKPPFPPNAAFGVPLAEPKAGMPRIGVSVMDGYGGLDKSRLKGLIERGFGKTLVEGYFASEPRMVILGGDYEGVAIIRSLEGIPYLDKFAVLPESQGRGIGGRIWKTIKELNPSLLWRAAEANPCNCWYERNSDGSERHGEWIVYWYNLSPGAASEAAAIAAGLPKTIIK